MMSVGNNSYALVAGVIILYILPLLVFILLASRHLVASRLNTHQIQTSQTSDAESGGPQGGIL
ncbi:MAG: hypothetical protein LBC35_05215 [Coriobacteriales bacterium]|jgi:hypothetical protein|nr:hypothetical protein [Coriobacteriales bacterium]